MGEGQKVLNDNSQGTHAGVGEGERYVELVCAFSREKTKLRLIPGQGYLVGCDKGNAIILKGNGVLAQHASLKFSDDVLTVEPASAAARVLVNGQI